MKKILVPTDFTDVANYALSMAQKIASKLEAEITLLHVVNTPSGVLTDNDGHVIDDGENDLKAYYQSLEKGKKQMAALEADLPKGIRTSVVEGVLNQAIVEFIKNERIDLVVMGTKGSSGLREILQGSETEIIVRKSPVPVLSLMCDRSNIQLEKILLVHDFKKAIVQDLEIHKALMAAFDAKLHLLKIIDGDESELVTEKEMREFAKANDLDSAVFHIFNDSDVEDGITHFLQEQDFDLLSIGTHGHKGFKHWLNGSVAEDLVNHLHKPILTFHLN